MSRVYVWITRDRRDRNWDYKLWGAKPTWDNVTRNWYGNKFLRNFCAEIAERILHINKMSGRNAIRRLRISVGDKPK